MKPINASNANANENHYGLNANANDSHYRGKAEGGSTQNAWTYIRGNHGVYKIIIFTIVVSNTWISGYDLRIRIYFDYKCVHRV